MEAIAIPLSFLVLVWVFGGLLAASLPMVVGLDGHPSEPCLVLRLPPGSPRCRFRAEHHHRAGSGTGDRLHLLIVSRYRDEIPRAPAATRLCGTLCTAGRTVLFSAMTVALPLSALLIFLMYFLKSFAYPGRHRRFFAAAAVIVTPPPSCCSATARRAGHWRWLRRALRHPEPVAKPVDQLFWYRSTTVVMRRAI